MPFTSDRAALIALTDALDPATLPPQARAALDAACCHLLGPDPALARLRRSLCETAQALDSVDRRLLHRVGEPYESPRGEVQRARAILQETAR